MMEFTDRYQALGIPYPDPETCCHDCDGTGWRPIKGAHPDDPAAPTSDLCTDPALLALWAAAEAVEHAEDGWHFVVCPTCSGTRLAPEQIDGSESA